MKSHVTCLNERASLIRLLLRLRCLLSFVSHFFFFPALLRPTRRRSVSDLLSASQQSPRVKEGSQNSEVSLCDLYSPAFVVFALNDEPNPPKTIRFSRPPTSSAVSRWPRDSRSCLRLRCSPRRPTRSSLPRLRLPHRSVGCILQTSAFIYPPFPLEKPRSIKLSSSV